MNYFYITGTSSGLGKAIAQHALTDARNVVYGFARRCTITHDRYIHETIDFSDLSQTKSIRFGNHPDAERIILINNAGTGGEIKYIGEIEDDRIEDGYHVNIISPHILMNHFMAHFKLNDCQKLVINITSGAASSAYDGWSIYCATKAALDMMSLCADKEQQIRNTGFRIFSIAPGVLDTQMQDQLRTTNPGDFSRIGKFLDLKKNDQLLNPGAVAAKIIDIVENPSQLYGVIHRLQL